MGFYLVQGGTTLKKMSTSGALTALTLPTGVTLDSTKRMRATVVGDLAIVVNSPSETITVDRFATVRILCPKQPSSPVTLSAVSGGTLTGTFTAWMTYFIKDLFGNIIAESDFGPVSAAQAVSSQYLGISAPVSPQQISGRKFYRSTTGPGTTKFPWFDVEDNLLTTFQDDLSDAGLQLIAAATDLGPPPDMELVASWRDRLWCKVPTDRDNLYYSGINRPFAFAPTNRVPIPPRHTDDRGITGFLPRRDELGVGKAGSIHKITGTTTSNFTRVGVNEKTGIWAPDSCVVINDVGYFLGNPFGVYTWDSNGITNITNEDVQPWFTTDTYFARGYFDQAVGGYDPSRHAYVLGLSAVGSTVIDRWVVYDITSKKWWGPHKTGEFTITGITTVRDENNTPMVVWSGADGKVYEQQTTKTDGSSTAIDMDCYTNWYSGGTPAIFKTFMQPWITTKVQAGGTLSVIPAVGEMDASAGSTISHSMTAGTETLRRIGDGKFCQIRFRENTAAQDVVIYGFELPFFENGRRT